MINDALRRELSHRPSRREPYQSSLTSICCSTGGNLTTGVQLAAYAFEYDADMLSDDTDFARFPGLRWHSPLA